MNGKRYIISDASKVLDVESHVLRYWEEELDIAIPRNEMGHRYYTEHHINLLRNVRDLKKQGYGLRTIRMMIGSEPRELAEMPKVSNKMEQFQEIMNDIVAKALRESGKELGKEIGREIGKEISGEIGGELSGEISKKVSENVSENVITKLDERLKINEEKEEERYRKLDEAIRNRQKQASGKKEKKKKEKRGEIKTGFALKRIKKPQTT